MISIIKQKIFSTITSESFRDCVFLAFVVIASLALYIGNLGFYSDDWAFLGEWIYSKDQSFIGLFNTFNSEHTQMRPVHGLYITALYWVFGLQPFGYHFVNSLIFVLISVTFYLVLRLLRLPRIIALTVPLVYSILPHYSTDRFWIAAFQANLSILFYFISLLSGLKAISVQTKKSLIWITLSIFCLILSTLSYEVVIPLFAFNIFLFWNPGKKMYQNSSFNKSKKWLFVLMVSSLISLGLVLIFKVASTTRLTNGPLEDLYGYPKYILYILKTSIWMNYKVLGIFAPGIIWKIITNYPNRIILTGGIGIGIVSYWYLSSVISGIKQRDLNKKWMFLFSICGFIVFILGYSIFFVNNNIGFTPTGIGNRVAIAAAIGIAISVVGAVGWVSSFIPSEKLSKRVFLFLISAVVAASFIINNTLAQFWVDAYKQEKVIVNNIKKDIPSINKGSTIILDGICAYNGPAVVFESSWDLKGALRTMYGVSELNADVVTHRFKVTDDGLYTKIYDQVKQYPYEKLFIYNFQSKQVYPVKDEETAIQYFEKNNFYYNANCPFGNEGNGVMVF